MKIKTSLYLAVAASILLAPATALAMQVDVLVDKVSQHMIVKVDGVQQYDWLISTGAPGYDTPSGNYHIFRLEKDHFSNEWDDAPMPYSMFFTGIGHALHGSFHVKSLGRAASHGCVRLHPDNAAILYGLIEKAGFKHNTVSVRGSVGFFQQEELLTTEQTFKMKPREKGAVAGLTPASSTENRPFWWQRPAAVEQPQAQQVTTIQKNDAPPKAAKKKVKLAKKGKKGEAPKEPNFFDFLKARNEG